MSADVTSEPHESGEGCLDCPHPDYCAGMGKCEIGAAKLAARSAAKVEYEAMVDVVIAASDQHDEKCGCEGEACKLGDALAKLDAVRGMRV